MGNGRGCSGPADGGGPGSSESGEGGGDGYHATTIRLGVGGEPVVVAMAEGVLAKVMFLMGVMVVVKAGNSGNSNSGGNGWRSFVSKRRIFCRFRFKLPLLPL